MENLLFLGVPILKHFRVFLNNKICCDPSLELSGGNSSNGGSQNMFLCGEIWLIVP